MKVKLYIKPEIDILDIDFGERIMDGNTYDHADTNDHFFDDEDIDYDDYDPFFDE